MMSAHTKRSGKLPLVLVSYFTKYLPLNLRGRSDRSKPILFNIGAGVCLLFTSAFTANCENGILTSLRTEKVINNLFS